MTDRTARQLTIASLLTETASVIHTNDLRDRPGRTPAQNSALPPAVSLYGAFNIVICGDPDDTRGDRDGVNSADLVRTFNAYLNQGSALEWSQAPERTHAEIMNALHACALALRDAAGRAELSASMIGDMFTGPRMLVHVGDVVRHTGMVSNLIVTSRHEDRGFWLTPESGGEPFVWDDYEMPGNEGSPFTLVSCPHLDDVVPTDSAGNVWGSWADADAASEASAPVGSVAPAVAVKSDQEDTDTKLYVPILENMPADPADDEAIETGPGFPVACASVHEHDPIACAPELPTDNVGTAGTVWSVTAESFDGTDSPMPAETFVVISDMDALIKAHRAAGASVEVSWPFGSDGTETPTYVHVYVDGRGVTTFRRANPGEPGTEPTTGTDDTTVFLERQNRALEAFRSRIAQEITITLQRIEGRGPDAKISASEVGRWLTELRTLANREHDRQMRL
jgi:hypothetical protein